MKIAKNVFPKDFLWGASTASHQVEGDNHNQWSVWELSHAAELAKSAAKRLRHLPNWKAIKDQAEDPANYVSGRSVDHFNQYETDFDLAKKLNLNALRFSIEWSRIEPEEGHWDEKAIEHYRRYIAALRERDLEPMLNIWHTTVPVWFAERGDFTRRANNRYFERFVQKVASELLEDVTYVITINEPNVYATQSYLIGAWPPLQKNVWNALLVYRNLVTAHRRAYKVLKQAKPTLKIGVTSQLANVQPKRPHHVVDLVMTEWMRYAWNWWFLNRIKKYQDFVGVNYYRGDYYKGARLDNPDLPLNDLGWYMEPEGLYPLLVRVWKHYSKPIIVTENGLADAEDKYREWWLEETMLALSKAISEGIDVHGYFHWSLLDNFEWDSGWWPKFGLVSVDRKHGMKRTIRSSATAWAKQLAELRTDKS